MSKVEFRDLPECVQLVAANLLRQQMEIDDTEKWGATAQKISAAFLKMYESNDGITIQNHGLEMATRGFSVGRTTI
ncbi:TPA: hypothetical protein ONC52_001988 [Enterobacter asburiae]|nr:hypothetical protein [Enterobacter asburiae]HCR2223669.1 hypothetical protein [Enterobacter asburiae]